MKTELTPETLFQSEHMYKRPSDYVGRDWFGYAAIVGRHRGSDSLTVSNFETAKKWLSPWLDDEESGVEIRACNHWAVGWTEEIMMKSTAPLQAVAMACKILNSIESYPVLSEDDWSNRQTEMAESFWASISEGQRLEIMKDCDIENPEQYASQSVPPFGADDHGYLWEALTAE
jgi:hypothetical protein